MIHSKTTIMTIISLFIKELEEEAITTRKMLSRIPTDKLDWRPHPKSMDIRALAGHIATLPSWITMTFTSDGLDFATSPYTPPKINSTADILEIFEADLVNGRTQLVESNAHLLDKTWTLRNGDMILSERPKVDIVRMTLSQIIHHRAQMGVYLRLLDVPIPGSYGPSADEQ
jgi:uncharacterized damage-inducible protein DinB